MTPQMTGMPNMNGQQPFIQPQVTGFPTNPNNPFPQQQQQPFLIPQQTAMPFQPSAQPLQPQITAMPFLQPPGYRRPVFAASRHCEAIPAPAPAPAAATAIRPTSSILAAPSDRSQSIQTDDAILATHRHAHQQSTTEQSLPVRAFPFQPFHPSQLRALCSRQRKWHRAPCLHAYWRSRTQVYVIWSNDGASRGTDDWV